VKLIKTWLAACNNFHLQTSVPLAFPLFSILFFFYCSSFWYFLKLCKSFNLTNPTSADDNGPAMDAEVKWDKILIVERTFAIDYHQGSGGSGWIGQGNGIGHQHL